MKIANVSRETFCSSFFWVTSIIASITAASIIKENFSAGYSKLQKISANRKNIFLIFYFPAAKNLFDRRKNLKGRIFRFHWLNVFLDSFYVILSFCSLQAKIQSRFFLGAAKNFAQKKQPVKFRLSTRTQFSDFQKLICKCFT